MLDLTIEKFNQGLKEHNFSLTEVTQEFLKEGEKKDEKIRSFLEFFKEESLERSKELDSLLEKDRLSRPLLFGSLAGIKDNILIKSKISSAGSKILEDYNATYDATVIKKLKEKGVIFLGRTNMDEFAMGSSTENSAYQITRNPWHLERVPGGSSGGSAAAVASGEVIFALGSDTGGSIRQPAGFCGVVGLKPTYGSVSRFGLIAMASSLDQIGPIAKTVRDAEIVFEAIKGKDSFDATSLDLGKIKKIKKDVKELKIGLPKEYFDKGLDKETERVLSRVIDFFKKEKFEIKEVSLPSTKYALSCYYIITTAEISANLARFDSIRYGKKAEENDLISLYKKTRGQFFGREVKRRIILGTFVLSSGYYDAYYLRGQKIRTLIKDDFGKVFEDVDVLLAPTSPTPAFKIGEKAEDPLQMYLSDIFTVPVSLAGLPAISIPADDFAYQKLPVGFQLITKPFHEDYIFELGKFYESLTDSFKKRISLFEKIWPTH